MPFFGRCHEIEAQPVHKNPTMLLLDAFGVFLAVALAFAVWGPDMWRWTANQLGLRTQINNRRERLHFD